MAAMDAAQAQVALKYDPQQAAIQRQIDAIKANTAANEQSLNTYGTTGRQAIGNTYDTLNSLLTGNRQQSASDLARQADLVGQGYDQANAYQQQVAAAGQARVNALAQQLNAGPAQVQAQSQLESTLANILGQNGQARAAATGNLGTWAGQWDQILGNGINIGEQTRAKASSDFETQLLKLLGDNRVSGLEGQNDMYGRLSDIIGARQNDLISTYNQLSQQDWENAFRQAQLDQEAQKANASLALQARGLDLQAAGQAADNAYRSAQGNLTPKDLIGLMMDQQQSDAAKAQQNFENNLNMKKYGLDEMSTLAQLQGNGDQGSQMLADFATKYLQGQDADPTALQPLLSNYANLIGGLGFDNPIYAQNNANLNVASHIGNFIGGHAAKAPPASSGGGLGLGSLGKVLGGYGAYITTPPGVAPAFAAYRSLFG